MLNERICELRDELNKKIEENADYEIIYNLSLELDKLIAEYYRETAWICEYGHLHNYSKVDFEELEREAENNKTYNNVKELIEDLEEE